MIIKTKIAGTTYYKGHERIPRLRIGDVLKLIREPGNKYDKNAIRINNGSGDQLGHIPRLDAVVLALLMDAGKEPKALVIGIVRGSSRIGYTRCWGVRIQIEY